MSVKFVERKALLILFVYLKKKSYMFCDNKKNDYSLLNG